MNLPELIELDLIQLSEYLEGLDKNQLVSVAVILKETLRSHHEVLAKLPLEGDLLEDGQGMMLGDVTYLTNDMGQNCVCGNGGSAIIYGSLMCPTCHARMPRGKDRLIDRERVKKEWRKSLWGQQWDEFAMCRCDNPTPGGHPYCDNICKNCHKWIEGVGEDDNE